MNPLKPFSIIDIVATGSLVTLAQIEESVKQIEALGFKARIPSTTDLPFILEGNKQSQNFNKKFQHLKKALRAEDSDAIWCIRGGYGTQKLMPYLINMKKPIKSKIFIGYSDVTVLQIYLNLKWQWPVLHFPVLVHVKDVYADTLKRFKDLLIGELEKQSFFNLHLLNRNSYKDTNIKSYIVGGNLTLIQSSIGTPWAAYFKNKILFLEDVGEVPYRIDRTLWQMLNAGVFKEVKAVILGDFIYSSFKKNTLAIKKTFQQFASKVNFPVIEGIPCGHGSQKEVLPFQTSCLLKIKSSKKAELHISSPFVKN